MILYMVFAEHRTGHHGVLNWICKQRGGIVHHNNPQLLDQGAYYVATRPDIGVTHYPGGAHDADLINLEGLTFTQWDTTWASSNAIRSYDELRPVVVVRRFRNWLASTACHPGNQCMIKNPDFEMVNKWNRMVNNYRDHLSAAMTGVHPFGANLVVVKFDHWFKFRAYRKQLAKRLQIPFTDDGLNDVPRFASGSTFDHREYDGKAQEMRVLERWKMAQGNPLFEQKMIEHQDLDELSEAYFTDS